MRLDEAIMKIDPQTVIAVKNDDTLLTHVGMCEDLMCEYGDNENLIVKEIEPNGYTDSDGISYLLIRWYDKTEQPEDELPFPLDEVSHEEEAD